MVLVSLFPQNFFYTKPFSCPTESIFQVNYRNAALMHNNHADQFLPNLEGPGRFEPGTQEK
jgi:hypothetical protein